ncbi:hypothetical protein ABPG74_017803 [Tetrahymena malaccensis]
MNQQQGQPDQQVNEINNTHQHEQEHRQTAHSITENMVGKLTFMGIAALVLFGFRLKGIPQDDVHCIVDVVHDYFNSWNKYVNENTYYSNLLIVTNSFMIDCIALGTYSYWLICVRNIRFMISIIVFYSLRTVHLHIFHMRFPMGYNWNEPTITSLTVPYGRTSDFFFSGHCGFLTLCFFELRALGWKKLSWIAMITMIYTAFVLIVLRVHYTIDITAGIIIAHYIHIQSQHYYVKIEKAMYSFQIYITKLFQCKSFQQNLEEEQMIYLKQIQLQEKSDQ